MTTKRITIGSLTSSASFLFISTTMGCTNDHTLTTACVITNSVLNATPRDLDITRMMRAKVQGPDPTLPRCRREHSLRDCWLPDPVRLSTHRLGFVDFLESDP